MIVTVAAAPICWKNIHASFAEYIISVLFMVIHSIAFCENIQWGLIECVHQVIIFFQSILILSNTIPVYPSAYIILHGRQFGVVGLYNVTFHFHIIAEQVVGFIWSVVRCHQDNNKYTVFALSVDGITFAQEVL